MGKRINDFIVESLGRCFLCMTHIPRNFNPPFEQESESFLHSSIYSLQYLANYLKMDLKKVFCDSETIPLKLLARVEKSNLKVSLCDNCANISTKLDKLIQKLEKIQLELKSELESFKSKLLEGDGIDKPILFLLHSNYDTYSYDGLQSEFVIMKILRSEAKRKCSLSLAKVPPRVKIEKLTGKEINAQVEMNKKYFLKRPIEKAKDFLKLDVDTTGPKIKLEENSPNDIGYDCMEDSNMYTDDSDEYQSHSQSQLPTSKEEYCDGDSTNNKFTHATPKSFRCRICSKEFATRQNLHRHFRTSHLKVKYPCKYKHCLEEFHHSSSRRRHYQVVHARMKFKCLKCNKLLSDQSNLTKHIRTVHAQAREHMCNECGFKFKAKYQLKVHQRKVHS